MDRAICGILVVDDDPIYRKMVSTNVKGDGYECQVAEDFQQALERSRDELIELVITAISIAGTGGIDLMKAVHEARPELPFIIMTERDNPFEYLGLIEAGAVDYILKPFVHAELTARIARLENEQRLLRALEVQSKELRRMSDYLENVFENSAAFICIVDRRGYFQRVNRATEELFGYTFEELKGKKCFEIYPNKSVLDRMLTTLRRDGKIKRFEIDIEIKDGSIKAFDLSLSLLRNAAGEVIGSVAVGMDLTDLIEAKREIETLLAERNRKWEQYGEMVRSSLVRVKGVMKD